MADRPLPFLKLKITIQGMTLAILLLQIFVLFSYKKLKREESKLVRYDDTETINRLVDNQGVRKEIEVKLRTDSTIEQRRISSLGEATTSQSNDKGSTRSKSTNNKEVNMKRRLVKLNDIKPSTSNIFFIESMCGTHKLREEEMKKQQQREFVLNVRQSCSVESAASMNPSRNVYVLLTCPVHKETTESEYAKELLSLENVWFVQLNMTEFYDGTPVKELYRSGRMEQSRYPVEHSSDIMRFTVLWRYGGIYMDLDVITLRQLDSLNNNFCGLEDDESIGSSILNFEPQGFGHELLRQTLENLNNNFNGNLWAVNGPQLITKIINEGCNTKGKNVKNCTVFKVYDKSLFYPVHYDDHRQLLSPELGQDIVDKVKKTSYVIHLWNHYIKKYEVEVNSTQAYSLLARQFCHLVYNSVKNVL